MEIENNVKDGTGIITQETLPVPSMQIVNPQVVNQQEAVTSLDRFMGIGMVAGAMLATLDSLGQMVATLETTDMKLGIEAEEIKRITADLGQLAIKHQQYIADEIQKVSV